VFLFVPIIENLNCFKKIKSKQKEKFKQCSLGYINAEKKNKVNILKMQLKSEK
jgi:hypothetical protein